MSQGSYEQYEYESGTLNSNKFPDYKILEENEAIELPVIVRVFNDGTQIDVPLTPETTCFDVIQCCRDPGEEICNVIAIGPQLSECPLLESDHPLKILQQWGCGRLVLRYTVLAADGGTYEKRNGMKEPDHFGETLQEGVQLTLSELREMACRQQAQIDSQHQLLAAKEQRLRYLKDQEARQQRVQAETERLRRLRDRVDAQELKLRKLRALRGQVDHYKQNNMSLTSDLESIRALFNEKEKELSLAVAKVEELTRQLEELRRGRARDQAPPTSALELDKLRRELMYRNKLNEQQNQRLNLQREALNARQEEMSSIDKRISELQERLQRKRHLNQQLANQINAVSNKPAAYNQYIRLTGQTDQSNRCYVRKPQLSNQPNNALTRGNIATVEPYNHVPLHQIRTQQSGVHENPIYHPVYQQNVHNNNTKSETIQDQNTPDNKLSNNYISRTDENDLLKEFPVSKCDPKYQTLPYNTKFTVNFIASKVNNRISDDTDNNSNKDSKEIEPVQNGNVNTIQSQHMMVHSAPLSVVNKNIAIPLNQNDLVSRKNVEHKHNYQNGDVKYTPNSPSHQKPISSVAPTSVHYSGKLSNVYQTSSIKVQPVEPQTITSKPPMQTQQSQTFTSPQASSTPVGTPDVNFDKSRPALPPKPAIKPPPRQTQLINESDGIPPPLPLTDPPDESKSPPNPAPKPIAPLPNQVPKNSTAQPPQPFNNSPTNESMPIIKAKPLSIKKQLLCEQPKLRSITSVAKMNGISLTNRRIEIPPAFNYSENVDKNLNEESIKEVKEKSPDDVTPDETEIKNEESTKPINDSLIRRCKKGNLRQTGRTNLSRRVSFDPLALLLDASLEGELELVKKTAEQVTNPSAANDEGITALHNAICAGHFEIVQFLVEFGCDVNAQDSDGWTPLHCAASCNNVAMVKFLVEHGACIFATTLSDHETAAEKCEEDEEGFDGCSEYLYSVQEKLGILSGGIVYAVFDYVAQQPDELSFNAGEQLTVLRKGDENEREWWWSQLGDKEGYVPRNLLGLYPRVSPKEGES